MKRKELIWLPEKNSNTNMRMEKLGEGTFSRVLTRRGNFGLAKTTLGQTISQPAVL